MERKKSEISSHCDYLSFLLYAIQPVLLFLNQAAWKRLKKNKGAVFGFDHNPGFVLVAVFAYFIAPDPSPYANRIILEIGGKKPGFEQILLK